MSGGATRNDRSCGWPTASKKLKVRTGCESSFMFFNRPGERVIFRSSVSQKIFWIVLKVSCREKKEHLQHPDFLLEIGLVACGQGFGWLEFPAQGVDVLAVVEEPVIKVGTG